MPTIFALFFYEKPQALNILAHQSPGPGSSDEPACTDTLADAQAPKSMLRYVSKATHFEGSGTKSLHEACHL